LLGDVQMAAPDLERGKMQGKAGKQNGGGPRDVASSAPSQTRTGSREGRNENCRGDEDSDPASRSASARL